MDSLALERVWRAVGNLSDDAEAPVRVRDLRALLLALDEAAETQRLYDVGDLVDASELRDQDASAAEVEADLEKRLADAEDRIDELQQELDDTLEMKRDIEAMRAA